jgi:hypothetical protein
MQSFFGGCEMQILAGASSNHDAPYTNTLAAKLAREPAEIGARAAANKRMAPQRKLRGSNQKPYQYIRG